MELKHYSLAANPSWLAQLLKWVNLRPEEGERTWMMFAFYTFVSVGLRWAEDSTVALFLDEYGAGPLPWMYIASAVMGMALVFVYSWLQKVFPLRWVVVAIAPCMVAPLMLLVVLRWGINLPYFSVVVVFLLRLWVDSLYVVNDLNTSIVANQLFNIREIKRTYPLISSGLLIADVISGFSLPWLLSFARLNRVIMIACGVIVMASAILCYLTYQYRSSFPDLPQRLMPQEQASRHRRIQAPLKRYTLQLFAFVGLLQVIGLLVDFQYLQELKTNLGDRELASFLGIFGGIIGLCELGTQWFFSSRLIERFGVFFTAALLPAAVGFVMPGLIGLLYSIPAIQSSAFFWGLVGLKFCDELLRYTFVVSSSPVLYQPIPERIRSRMQALSGGTAEAIATGAAGIIILITMYICGLFVPPTMQKWVFVGETMVVAVACLKVVWLLRSRYVDLLVLSAERGELSAANVGLRAFQQGVVKALEEKGNTADKHSCIELLAQIDPQGAADVLAPILFKLPSDLQRHSLEVMLTTAPTPAHLSEVRWLLERHPDNIDPEVFALALRYVWLADPNPNLSQIEEYLHQRHHSLTRATAAALLLRQGTPLQKIAATKTLRRMLTHKQERERVNGVKALREVVYLQALRIHIPNLLQDESLRVRCAVLEMIASTRMEEYYSALLTALYYKSTRATAMRALVKMENEALNILLQIATNAHKPEVLRMYAWRTIAQICTTEAVETLWLQLESSWGTTRHHILRSLLKIQKQSEMCNLVDKFQQSRVENLIEQELRFLGEIYGAYLDLQPQSILENNQTNQRVKILRDLLQRALTEMEWDIRERILLLLKLLYSPEQMQAAAFNLRSESVVNLAKGLEILEHTVNLPTKSLLLNILDKRSHQEKLSYLLEAKFTEYQQMSVSERLQKMLSLAPFLSDWCLACCFHFAQASRIRLTINEILLALRHPTGFVREAAIAYLSVVSHRVLLELLPKLQKDTHPLVAMQIQELIKKYQFTPKAN
ncbi:MFS transporter [Anabaena azotica]|uniref:MFS transporter n=1 Tax=Anabaena azotica FACHB-119 TaxID=947527 RepID=A0ABR8DBZ6_9NOST|nr:MFS transporter [Anabaena azotica]MBD2504013.1 MFS transporter [Anabaena azotica FACHB-119]